MKQRYKKFAEHQLIHVVKPSLEVKVSLTQVPYSTSRWLSGPIFPLTLFVQFLELLQLIGVICKKITMLIIINDNTNPWFNLASEEYLIKNFKEDIFMLWRDEPSVIVGKHQNTLAEINLDFVKEKGIKVVRRLSGGGAVFHDLGNLNFTFIMNGEDEKLIDFKRFTLPIIEVLAKLDVQAEFSGRNDLLIDGRKFSGNAEHVYKKRVLHHGTLLFSSEITDLSDALKVNPSKFTDKAVKSVRSRVTNITEHLKKPMDVITFRNLIQEHINTTFKDTSVYSFNNQDIDAINKLVDEKYSTWEWNFGYSPSYNFSKTVKTNGGHIEMNLDVEKGIIRKVKIFGDFFNLTDISELEEILVNTEHNELKIRKKLSGITIGNYFNNVEFEEFIEVMF